MITLETHERICEDLRQQLRALVVENERLRAGMRLTDDQIGRLWFDAKVPGLLERDARLLIRAAEGLCRK